MDWVEAAKLALELPRGPAQQLRQGGHSVFDRGELPASAQFVVVDLRQVELINKAGDGERRRFGIL